MMAGSAGSASQRAQCDLVRLAHGLPIESIGEDEGAALLARSEEERLTSLAWKRSPEFIRSAAPTAAGAWQRRALLHGVIAGRQLDALAACIAKLRSIALQPVVLKGPPLAKRLYDDYTVRHTVDCDVFLPGEQRTAASRALSELGWRCIAGEAPEEETYELAQGQIRLLLELHSSAFDDPLLRHVQLPIEAEEALVGGYSLPSQAGRFLPAYLAVHLAKHGSSPLLWIVDFAALWSRLDERGQGEATCAAREVGLHRHLEWAVALCAVLTSMLHDQPDGRQWRFWEDHRRPIGNLRRMARLIALSAGPRDAIRVMRGRFKPHTGMAAPEIASDGIVYRAIRWVYRRLIFERPSGSFPADTVSLGSVSTEQALTTRLSESGCAWIAPGDSSMEPAVPSFARARIVPLGGRALRGGDVVLAQLPQGGCVLRRAANISADGVRLRADAGARREMVVPLGNVLGVCDQVDIGGRMIRIEERPHHIASLLRAIARGGMLRLSPRREV